MKVGTRQIKPFARIRATGVALLFGVFAFVGVASPLAAQSRAVLEKVIRRQVLPNGLEVIVYENHGVPLATVEFDVKNGAFVQTKELAGLAHLYEHMFFKANARYPDADAFLARTSALGARFNATTQEERVNYYITVQRDSLTAAMQFMNAAIRTPLFRADELAQEREVVLGEYDRNESNPMFGFMQEMDRVLYGAEWHRKNTIGDREVIRTATPEQMRFIQKRYYVPNNTALIVSGDVQSDSVFALATRLFADWPRQPDPFTVAPLPALPLLAADDAIVTEAPVSAVSVMLRWNGPSVGKDPAATYAADVFSDALNQPGSKFQQRLVDSGLWLGVGVNYYTLNQNGPITISGQTTVENYPAAMRALEAEIAKFTEPGYITEEELRHTQAARTVSSAFGLERSSDLAHTIGFWWSVASLDYFLGYVDNMAAMTLADLRGYAAKYIAGKPRLTGVLLSPQDRATLKLTRESLASQRRVP
ncbi:MAG: pitrilysin family protein [Gemmatimonadaceae bacterium]|nr:pitrilysin family protein [Gemmatimonadaceae bacterium]